MVRDEGGPAREIPREYTGFQEYVYTSRSRMVGGANATPCCATLERRRGVADESHDTPAVQSTHSLEWDSSFPGKE